MASEEDDTLLLRLCSLIDTSLRPFTELELISLTKDKERQLLISLSQIYNLIGHWKNDVEQGSNNQSFQHLGEHQCLTTIVANLFPLLNVKSQHVQHLVGNIFLAISEFLLAYGDNWDTYIHCLCVCFEFVLCNTLPHSSQPSIHGAEDLKSMMSNMSLVLNKSSWNVIAGITRILRGIIKHLKGQDDAEIVGILLNSLVPSLSKVPWDLLNGIHNDTCTEFEASSGDDTLLMMNIGEIEAKILFLGNLVQLLCSLVGLTDVAEAEAGSHCKSAILRETCGLIPRLLNCCLAEQLGCRYRRILPYFQHKILMLMIRFSFHTQLDCLVLVSWLQLLHEYCQDLLLRPFSQLECGQDYTLEGSPFLLSLYDQEAFHLASHHLQRKAVFLLLRCSLSLISLGNTADIKCACTRSNSFFEPESKTIKDCFGEKKGLLEIYGWLQGHVPSDMFSVNDVYLDRCIKFASSFIRLYMHEDDMLFEVLLQMFTIPLSAERLFSKEGRSSHDAKEDILFHVSNLFNPLLLFHVFLAELQYDHQLLLDYLISKDTGSKCAEYLLRCLRTVCDSWKLFVEISVRKGLTCRSSCPKSSKRIRMFEDTSEERIVTPVHSECVLSPEQHKEESNSGSEVLGNRSLQFEDVKSCLLSLRIALRKLHRRKLFPYNPQVLIKRLTRFEELCNQHV